MTDDMNTYEAAWVEAKLTAKEALSSLRKVAEAWVEWSKAERARAETDKQRKEAWVKWTNASFTLDQTDAALDVVQLEEGLDLIIFVLAWLDRKD